MAAQKQEKQSSKNEKYTQLQKKKFMLQTIVVDSRKAEPGGIGP